MTEDTARSVESGGPAPAPSPTAPSGSPPARRRRWLRWTLAGGAVGLVVLVAAGPTIAGLLAPALAPGFVPVQGKVVVESASLGWFSGQSVGPVRILDAQGREVVSFTASTGEGLFKLMTGSMDFGAVKVQGKADVVVGKDGSTNLERVLASTSPAAAGTPGPKAQGEARLPKGLAAQVEGTFDVRYTDERDASRSASIKGLKVKADVAAGQKLTASVEGRAEGGSAGGGKGGEVRATIVVDGWSNADGTLGFDPANPLASDKVRADVTVEVAGLPAGLIDAFSPSGPRVAEVVGEAVSGRATVKGTGKDLAVAAGFEGANARGSLEVVVQDGRVKGTKPIELFATGRSLAALAPQAKQLTEAGGPTRVDALPDVTVRVADLLAKVPAGGLDLRGAAATVTVTTTAVKGRVVVGEGKLSTFEIAPVTATVTTQDLGAGTAVKVATTATIDGRPGGVVDVDLSAGSLLDGGGKFVVGLPAGLRGKAEVTGVATAIAQPFVEALGVDLAADIGPTLEVRVAARAGEAAAGQAPPADLDVALKSRELEVIGGVTVSQDRIATRGDGLRAEGRSAARIAQKLMGAKPAVVLGPAGAATVTAKQVSVPLDGERRPVLAKAAGVLEVSAGNWTAAPAGGAGVEAVQARALTATVTLAPDQPVVVAARGTLSHEGKAFAVAADVRAPGLLTADPAHPINRDALLSTLVKLEAAGVPASLAKLMPAAAPAAGPNPGVSGKDPLTPADIAAILRDAVGPTVDVKLETANTTGKGLSLSGSAVSASLEARVAGTLLPKEVSLTTIMAEAKLTPEAQALVLPRFVANAAELPQLTGSAVFRVTVDPVSIPMKPGLVPDLEAAQGVLAVTLSSPGQVLARVPVKAGGAASVVGVRGLAGKATLPLQVALGKKGERGALSVTMEGVALRQAGGPMQEVGTVSGAVSGEVVDLNPAAGAPLRVTADARGISGAFLDEVSNNPGMVTGALGDTATLQARVVVTPAAPAWAKLAEGSINAEVDIASPKFKSDKPVKLAVLPDRLALQEGTTFTWTLDPAFFAKITAKDGPAPLRLGAPVPVTLGVRKAAVSRGAGPLKPGVFDLDFALSTPAGAPVELTASDGTASRLTGLKVSGQRAEDGVRFALEVDQAQAGKGDPVKGIKIPGSVTGLADASGALTPDAARVSVVGELPAVPTVLLDTLAAQNGLLVEALGPVTTIKVNADRFGRGGGTLTALASSARASFDLAGSVKDGLFVNGPQTPLKVGVSEITQDLSKRLVKGLPLFGSVEKSAKDRPASIVGTNLKVPLTNDLSKLDGDFAIDPGEVNFQIAGDFADILAGPILAATKGKASGVAGKKLTPMNVQVRSGVMTLARWPVPVGEFTLSMDGTMNLATGEMNFTTYIPAGAMALEKLKLPGPVGAIAGDVLKSAVIPVRTHGTSASRRTSVDTDAAAKELFKGIDPGKLLDGLLKKPAPKN